MLQLFKKTFNFAWQEMKERCGFWYKICLIIMAKFFGIMVLFSGMLIALISTTFWARPYLPQNYTMAWTVLLWSGAVAIAAFCVYYVLKISIKLSMELMATFLAGAKDQCPTKVVSEASLAPFACLLAILSFFGMFALGGQRLIIFYTESKILGALFFIVVSLWAYVRLHFSYFIILEKTVAAKSACSVACASIKQSFKLTHKKFSQLFLIVFSSQALSYFGVLASAFDLNQYVSQSSTIIMYLIFMVALWLALPFCLLMYARAYVLLDRNS